MSGDESVAAVAVRRRGYTHDVEVGGHSFVADEPKETGGADEGPSPTCLVAAALASCTAITVEMYAERKGWELGEGFKVDVYTEGDVKSGRSYTVTLHLRGGMNEEQTRRIKTIAGKCPVHKLLAGATPISIEDRVTVD